MVSGYNVGENVLISDGRCGEITEIGPDNRLTVNGITDIRSEDVVRDRKGSFVCIRLNGNKYAKGIVKRHSYIGNVSTLDVSFVVDQFPISRRMSSNRTKDWEQRYADDGEPHISDLTIPELQTVCQRLTICSYGYGTKQNLIDRIKDCMASGYMYNIGDKVLVSDGHSGEITEIGPDNRLTVSGITNIHIEDVVRDRKGSFVGIRLNKNIYAKGTVETHSYFGGDDTLYVSFVVDQFTIFRRMISNRTKDWEQSDADAGEPNLTDLTASELRTECGLLGIDSHLYGSKQNLIDRIKDYMKEDVRRKEADRRKEEERLKQEKNKKESEERLRLQEEKQAQQREPEDSQKTTIGDWLKSVDLKRYTNHLNGIGIVHAEELFTHEEHILRSVICVACGISENAIDMEKFISAVMTEQLKRKYQNLEKENEALKKKMEEKAQDVMEIGDNFKCTICLELIIRAVALRRCGHSFCNQCIITWLSEKENCPTCRMTAKETDLVPQKNVDNTLHDITNQSLTPRRKAERKRRNDEFEAWDRDRKRQRR